MKVSLVAAVAENGVIGADGTVPWYYPADLEHFKSTTVGHPVIVGRRTFETIREQLGEPLPDRHNVVLTHRPGSLPDTVAAASAPSEALEEAAATGADTAYVVGGAAVYEQFLGRADELVLTEIHDSFEGDTTFPAVDWDRWRVRDRERHESFDIVTYVRKDDGGTRPEGEISDGE